MVQIGTISKYAYHVKFQFHKLPLFSKHINPSFPSANFKMHSEKKNPQLSLFVQWRKKKKKPKFNPSFFLHGNILLLYSSSTCTTTTITHFFYTSQFYYKITHHVQKPSLILIHGG